MKRKKNKKEIDWSAIIKLIVDIISFIGSIASIASVIMYYIDKVPK